MKNALIIFVRNPELGKVKTRLAATIGDQKALDIYIRLLAHTRELALSCHCDKYVFASGPLPSTEWEGFYMEQQSAGDLGNRMSHAFELLFRKAYEKVVIIGSDCLELSGNHLIQAFTELEHHDVVIGPANDGGYYLLAMKKHHAGIFSDKSWGTNSVFNQTVKTVNHLGLQMQRLENLNDIDEVKDLPEHMRNLL